MFAPAGQPELVRSNQKDVYYLGFLREGIAQIYRSVRGPFSWIKWKTELDLLADICYFGLTTISGFQTLGEEYCNIVQVDSSKTRIPSTLLRGSLFFLYSLGPYLIDKALTRLELWLQSQGNFPYGLHPRGRQTLSALIPFVRAGVVYVHRAHLALFYLNGIFYHIAKRITGIRYLLVRNSLRNDGSRPTYRLLGYLSVIQLIITLILTTYQHLKSGKPLERLVSQEKSASTNITSGSSMKCALCLERLRDKTVTPCGHLFCWNCITEWCVSKPECPLCRESVQLSRLVFLHHYEAT